MHPSTSEAPDAELVIEAATVEEALAQVAAQLGSDADIVGVEKVLRGGIGGFFAKEQVQIAANRRSGSSGTTPGPSPAPAEGNEMQRLLSRLASDTDAQERSFAETLRSQLKIESPRTPSAAGSVRPPDAPPSAFLPSEPAPRPAAAATSADQPAAAAAPTPQPAPAAHPAVAQAAQAEQSVQARTIVVDDEPVVMVRPVAPAPVVVAPPVPAAAPTAAATPAAPAADRVLTPRNPVLASAAPGMPSWSQDNLRRLGLPNLVVDACDGLDPRDDLGWVHAVGRAVASLCRPLPSGDSVIAGPKVSRYAAAWDVPLVKPGSAAPRRGSFCAAVRDSDQHRGWLAWARGARWLHLVVGGERWRDLLFDEPLAVSWTGDDQLPEAISLCADLGMVLGYGLGTTKGEEPRRANPVDVAMAVRSLLPKR